MLTLSVQEIYILISSRHVYHGSISKPRAFHVAGLAAGELVRDRSRSEATGGQTLSFIKKENSLGQ